MKKYCFKLVLLLSPLCISFSIAAAATTFEIFTSTNPPYVENIGNSEKDAKGVALEIVIGAFAYNKNQKKSENSFIYPENDIPWKRVQTDAQEKQNSILVPLTRTIELENLYSWITPIFDDEINVYGLSSATALTLDDLKATKQSSIGVYAGGGAYYTLKDLKFSEVLLYPLKTEEQNLEMLIQKEHIYWATQELIEKYIVNHSNNIDKKNIKKLMSIKKIELWVVTSKKTSEKDVSFLTSLFNDFKKTNEYFKIINTYKNM